MNLLPTLILLMAAVTSCIAAEQASDSAAFVPIQQLCKSNHDCRPPLDWCYKGLCRSGVCGSNADCPSPFKCWRGNCAKHPF
ncbi:hypothetical protein BJX96DRAFT_155019 [Aspergillus floccosus]